MQDILSSLTTFDYICLILLLCFVINGAAKGFIKELSGVIGLLLSVVVAKIVSIPVTLKIYEFFDIRSKILYKLKDVIQDVYTDKVGSSIEELKAGLNTVLEKFSFIGDYISPSVKEDYGVYEVLKSGKDTLVEDLSIKLMSDIEPLVQYFLSVIVFIVLCIVIGILVKLVMNMLSSAIKDIPIVGSMNTLLGICLGLVKGICFVIFVTLLSFLLISVFGDTQGVYVKSVLDSKIFELVSSFKYFVK